MEIFAQKIITFPSLDGLNITSDYYENKIDNPWILLFHQANYSRGEYKETAERFMKMGYNCLAVDLRSGNEINFIKNKTAEIAKEKNLSTTYLDALKDLHAAVEYAYLKSKKPVILVGSSYSASLSLMLAKDNSHVKAVIVFSPGEYFEKDNFIRDYIEGLSKPVFAASSANEYEFMIELLSKIDKNKLTTFKPLKGQGEHGSKALWKSNPTCDEYWLALMMFFDQIK
jgi:pimeloyl-ACP methyl ester carboxylesterase